MTLLDSIIRGAVLIMAAVLAVLLVRRARRRRAADRAHAREVSARLRDQARPTGRDASPFAPRVDPANRRAPRVSTQPDQAPPTGPVRPVHPDQRRYPTRNSPRANETPNPLLDPMNPASPYYASGWTGGYDGHGAPVSNPAPDASGSGSDSTSGRSGHLTHDNPTSSWSSGSSGHSSSGHSSSGHSSSGHSSHDSGSSSGGGYSGGSDSGSSSSGGDSGGGSF